MNSLFSLRRNRVRYATDHPRSVQDGIFVNGFDIAEGTRGGEEAVFERAAESLRPVAAAAGVELLLVRTNVRNLYVRPRGGRTDFWSQWYHGAGLAAVAHALSGRIDRAIIASSLCPENLEPWGSHPLLDPNWGSSRVEVAHDLLFSRLEKVRVVAEWPPALRNLRVCLENLPDPLNCCRCLLCVTTMTHLFLAGKLDAAEAFVDKSLTPAKLRDVCARTCFADLRVNLLSVTGDLERMGRGDLAEVVRREFSLRARVRRASWKKRLFALDGRWTGGSGARGCPALRSSGTGSQARRGGVRGRAKQTLQT